MPTYAYRCQGCGHDADILHGFHDSGIRNCAQCGDVMRKVFSPPAIIRAMGGDAHFNSALGRHVTGARDMRDGFRAKSDQMSERMGFAVDYQPVDRRDRERLGVTGEGLESQERARTASGQRETRTILS